MSMLTNILLSSTKTIRKKPPPADPYFNNVTLLLQGEESTIIDRSSAARTITTVGSAAVNTSIKKFGTGSIAVLGGGNTASFYENTGTISIASGEAFTMEAWVYLMASGRHCILGEPRGSAYATAWGFCIFDTISNTGTDNSVKGICWVRSPISGYGGNIVCAGQYPTLQTWTHIAMCRDASNNWSFYMDGVKGTTRNTNSTSASQVQFPTDTGPSGALSIPVYTGNFDGFTSGGNSSQWATGLNAYIDDLRVTVGVARYSETFTPPTRRFSNY